jgi:hypothetical protein
MIPGREAKVLLIYLMSSTLVFVSSSAPEKIVQVNRQLQLPIERQFRAMPTYQVCYNEDNSVPCNDTDAVLL